MGTLLVKPGVDMGTSLTPAGARILEVLKQAVSTYSFDVTITSGRDGEHSGPNDPHRRGSAFDLRTKDLTPAQKALLLADLRAGLYREPRRFYVFLEAEGTANEHIHSQERAGTTYGILDYLSNS